VRVVDAFTDHEFSGNPAAVCLLGADEWPEAEWMRRFAAEANLPMSAFVRQPAVTGAAEWGLRWFTPTREEPFCGHATLASAHVLFSEGITSGEVRFDTLACVLGARHEDDGAVTLDFPAASVSERGPLPGLAEALGGAPQRLYATGALRDVLALFDSEAEVRNLRPDLDALATLFGAHGLRGAVPTAAADAGAPHHFVSRFFSPHEGFPEDQVTGSAHTALAPFWSARLGRDRLRAVQASPRGGSLTTEVRGDRVLLTGHAVTVIRGELLPAPRVTVPPS